MQVKSRVTSLVFDTAQAYSRERSAKHDARLRLEQARRQQ